MGDYYVSAENGDDANPGTQTQPWATITKAAQTLVAGDTVHISPGTYREKPTVANAGSSGNEIVFRGEPQCADVATADQGRPGMVRLTGCGTDELPTSGVVLTVNPRQYVITDGLVVDGSSDNYAIDQYSNSVVRRCSVHSYMAARYGTYERSLLLGSIWTVVTGRGFDRCITFTGQYGVELVAGTAERCLFVGGRDRASTIQAGTHAYNCIGFASGAGFYGSGTVHNCLAVGCRIGFYNVVRDATQHLYCWQPDYLGSGDASVAAKAVLWDLWRLAFGLQPSLADGVRDWGANLSTALDLLGRLVPGGDGTEDVGPWELADWSLDFGVYYANAPSIKIPRKGDVLLRLSVKSARAVTLRWWVRHDNTTGDKPQLVLRGPPGDSTIITTQTDTHDGADTVWQQLSVTAAPTHDGVVDAVLRARDTGATAIAYFSDPVLTGAAVELVTEAGLLYQCLMQEGAETITMQTVTVDDGTVPLAGAAIVISADGGTTWPYRGRSDQAGQRNFSLPDGSVTVQCFLAGYTHAAESATVSGDSITPDTFSMTEFDPGTPPAPNECIVYGTIRDAEGNNKSGVTIEAWPSERCHDDAGHIYLHKDKVTATTNASGYFEISLIRSSELHDKRGNSPVPMHIRIEDVGYDEDVLIPDADNVALEELEIV